MSIKILWLEDEFKESNLAGTIAKAQKLGFEITFCEFANDFIADIDTVEWDAIVLDVIGKRNSGDTLGSDGFNLAFDKVLASYKDRPWFVFSGQTEITKKDSLICERLTAEHCQREYAEIIYVKGDDNDKLFKDIENVVKNNEDWQLRHEYADILATSVDKIITLKLLKALKKKEAKDTSLLNDIRKILEDIFNECCAKGLFEASVRDINERKRRLAGHTSIPKYIQRNIDSVTLISQEGSHVQSQTYKDINSGKAPYLIGSTINDLLNIILWWNQYKNGTI